MVIKVRIDQEKCIACGLCYGMCPDVFEADDNGKSRLVEKYRTTSKTEGEVPDTLKSCVEDAKNGCPVGAIEIE